MYQRPIASRAHRVRVAVTVLIVAGTSGCGGGSADGTRAHAETRSGPGGGPVAAAGDPDPCAFLSRAEAEAILGPLRQPPERLNLDFAPDPAGPVCAYPFTGTGYQRTPVVHVEVRTHDGLEFEAAASHVTQGTAGWLPNRALGDTSVVGPWDAAARIAGGLMTARQGDVAVQVSASGMRNTDARLDSIAARVLRNIPDVAIAAPPARDGNDQTSALDPCRVLTRTEVEAVIGPLSAPPYRTRASTSMAEDKGASCAYRTPHHRVLVVSPTWEGGAVAFKLAAVVGHVVAATVAQGQEADTLDDGPWDSAASDTQGSLLLLKGDALLDIRYRTASTDLAGAARLGRLGLPRM